MATLMEAIESRGALAPDAGERARLRYWGEVLGQRELESITADDIDVALSRLRERGGLWAGRGKAAVPVRTGRPLTGSTLNRFLSTLGGLYRFARRARLVPRAHVPPTRGIEKAPEYMDPEKYLRPEEVSRLVRAARRVDRRWMKLAVLITLAFHTGLRRGNLLRLRWRDIDLRARTATVLRTKNGSPHIAVLTERCVRELQLLPVGLPDAYVFAGPSGVPYDYRPLWRTCCRRARLPGRTLHWLRHGCGSALATAGASQAQIMQVMGHRTLLASARYIHSNVEDRRKVVERVFK